MVQLILTDSGTFIDLTGTDVTYVKTASDIGDISKVNTSYSWAFKVPKTPDNIAWFKGLSLAGSTSDFAYVKQPADLTDNGFPIVRQGLLKVRESADDYRCYLQEGIIEWYRAIQNDKVSEAVDLSALDHENTVANIVGSWSLETYRYIISAYNGPPLADISGTTNLNPFALVPSINIQYLIDQIFATYGWTYENLPDLSNKWMTYPNAISYDEGSLIRASEHLQDTDLFLVWGDTGLEYEVPFENTTSDDTYTQTIGNTIRVLQTGAYRFTFFARNEVRYNIEGSGGNVFIPAIVQIWKNGVLEAEELSDETTWEGTVVVDLVCAPDDIIEAKIKRSAELPLYPVELRYYEGSFFADVLGVETISFSEALIKYKIKDFFKEVLMRESLTATADTINKIIKFQTLDDKLSADVIDWSDKYIRRTSEKYVYDSYTQSNYLRHKYEDSEDDYFDGELIVNNENLPEEKDLFKSKTYAPLEELEYYNSAGIQYAVQNFKMFNIDVKEDADTGDLLADYKPLKNRFYIFNAQTVTGSLYILGELQNTFPLATISGNTFKDIVAEKYANINQILDKTIIHSIELDLLPGDILDLDLEKRYWFEQEQANYVINKITYKPEGKHTGEFVKVTGKNLY
jgi:hypothetical protein